MTRNARRARHSCRALAAVGIALAGCGAVLPSGAPPECGFPAGTELAWVGESSLSRLGLRDNFDVEGVFYVTAEPLPGRTTFGPKRQWCVIATDGHAEVGPVPDNLTFPP